MALLYISPQTNGEEWRTLFCAAIPDLDFRIAPEIGDPGDIEAALVWGRSLDSLKDFPNLKMVASLGAGVDHVIATRLHRDADIAAVLSKAAEPDSAWVPAGAERTALRVEDGPKALEFYWKSP